MEWSERCSLEWMNHLQPSSSNSSPIEGCWLECARYVDENEEASLSLNQGLLSCSHALLNPLHLRQFPSERKELHLSPRFTPGPSLSDHLMHLPHIIPSLTFIPLTHPTISFHKALCPSHAGACRIPAFLLIHLDSYPEVGMHTNLFLTMVELIIKVTAVPVVKISIINTHMSDRNRSFTQPCEPLPSPLA